MISVKKIRTERMAMICQEITKMLSAYPATSSDPDFSMKLYLEAAGNFTTSAVIETAQCWRTGKVDRSQEQRYFAPSVEEFPVEIRNVHEFHMARAANENRKRPSITPSIAKSDPPFLRRMRRRELEYADCRILAENVSFNQWKQDKNTSGGRPAADG